MNTLMLSLLGTSPGYAEDGPPRDDLFVSSLGTEVLRADAIGVGDLDMLVGQRVRWKVADELQLLADLRFAYDPDAATHFEESRARELGVALERRRLTVLAGRHPVQYGGPRLVDGVQVFAHPGPVAHWSLGGWVGLAADEFTTAPSLRPGGGPIVAASQWWGSASLMGEFIGGAGGIERIGSLFLGRAEVGRYFEISTRIDAVYDDGAGHAGLADGALAARYRPSEVLRIDLSYDAYSTLRYQAQSELDPTVQRFTARAEQLGLTNGVTQDLVDPTLQHAFGAVLGLRGRADVAPFATLRSTVRYHPDPTQRFVRIGPQIGVSGLAADRIDLWVDGNVLTMSGELGGDVGVAAFVEPIPEGAAAVDGSFRMLVDPLAESFVPGWYADLFLDVLSRTGTVVSGGGSWTLDRGEGGVRNDVGWAGFLRIQQWIRPGRSISHPSAANPSSAADKTPTEIESGKRSGDGGT